MELKGCAECIVVRADFGVPKRKENDANGGYGEQLGVKGFL